jgi:CRISPR-associated protein Cas1
MRGITDLTQLPRTADSWTFLYIEKVRVERVDSAIELRDKNGRVPVPIAALSALLLGPGSVITHAAVSALAESGCSAVWCGEGVARFYAGGLGDTRRAHHIEAQARAWADDGAHLETVKRLYAMRFADGLAEGLSIAQIRGHEGVRVRDAYARISRETGVEWKGRNYKRNSWGSADAVNRALSAANACLYGVCHAAIVATGFSPALGFLHIGKQLSFVYDIADLYKVDLTVPAAFQIVADSPLNVESRVRRQCRDLFYSSRLLERIVPDLQAVVGLAPSKARLVVHRGPEDVGELEDGLGEDPGALWAEGNARVSGGQNYGATSAGTHQPKPGIAKAHPDGYERGDAYEDDLEWPAAGSELAKDDPF